MSNLNRSQDISRVVLEKLAEESRSLVPSAVASGLFLSPFAGLIGEKPITKDPFFSKNIVKHSIDEIEHIARPGDIVLTSSPGLERKIHPYKIPQTLFTGSEFYHAEAVIGKVEGKAITSTLVPVDKVSFKPRKLRFQIPIRKMMKDRKYSTMVLLRPEEPLTPKQLKAYKQYIKLRSNVPYGTLLAIRSFLKDIFIPKSKWLKTTKDPAKDICSTLAAGAHEAATQKGIVRGKGAFDILPADFLRKGSGFKPIAVNFGFKPVIGPFLKRYMRLGSRGVLGAGLAATGYGVSKLVES